MIFIKLPGTYDSLFFPSIRKIFYRVIPPQQVFKFILVGYYSTASKRKREDKRRLCTLLDDRSSDVIKNVANASNAGENDAE